MPTPDFENMTISDLREYAKARAVNDDPTWNIIARLLEILDNAGIN